MTNVTVEVDDLKALLAVAKLSVEERQRLEILATERADRGLMQTLHRVPDARERLEAQANEAARVENGAYEASENIILAPGELQQLSRLMGSVGRGVEIGAFGEYESLKRFGFVEVAPIKHAVFWSGQDIPSYDQTRPPLFAYRLTHRGKEYALMQGMQIDDPADAGLKGYLRRKAPHIQPITEGMTFDADMRNLREDDGA